MSKFKVGDWVKILRGGYPVTGVCNGDVCEIAECDGHGYRLKPAKPSGPFQHYYFCAGELEPATPTEHPALTLAKSEVVRLHSGRWDHSPVEQGQIRAYRKILRAFGLEYRAKPVVPQPVEYEFVTLDDTRGSAPQESVR